MRYIQNFQENMKYVKYGKNDKIDEGAKHWLATFLLLTNLGMVPINIQRADAQTKMEYVKNLPQDKLHFANFLLYLNNNIDGTGGVFGTGSEKKVRALLDQYNKENGTNLDFDYVYKNIHYESSDDDTPESWKMGKSSFSDISKDVIIDIDKLKPVNYITDYYELIDDTYENQLNNMLKSYEQKTDVEIAVLTIPSLYDQDMSDYAINTFNRWGVGKAATNNGVLICISVPERKWQIVTGYGVESVLTDYDCSSIGNSTLVPNFKQKKYQEGIDECIKAIMEEIGSENIEYKKERIEKENAEYNRIIKDFFITFAQILLGLLGGSGIVYLLYRRNKKLQALKNEINSRIEQLNEMGANLTKIESSGLLLQSKEIEKLKKDISNIKGDVKYKKSYLERLENEIGKYFELYKDYINKYNTITRTVKEINKIGLEIGLVKEEYPDEIKNIIKDIKKQLNFVDENMELDKAQEYEKNLKTIYGLHKNYHELKELFNKIKSEEQKFGSTRDRLFRFVHDSIGYAKYINAMGYKNPELPTDEEVKYAELLMNKIKETYMKDFREGIELFRKFSASVSNIKDKSSKIASYEDYIRKAKHFVDTFSVDSTIKRTTDLKTKRFANIRAIDSIIQELGNLRPYLQNITDYVKIKQMIEIVLQKIQEQEDYINRKIREEREEEERRREEEERRRRRQRDEEEERNRSYYDSSSSSSSSDSGFSGFGGGRTGGGGAGGGW